MCWGRLISHIHEKPVETKVHLIARISSLCVNVQKFARYICARTQRTVCVTSSITIKSQASWFDSSCELFDNISAGIYNNKCTIEIYEKKNTKNLDKFFRLVYLKYSMLSSL